MSLSPARLWVLRQVVRHVKSIVTCIEEWLRREEEDTPSTEVK